MTDISLPGEAVALDGADQHEAAEFVLRLGNALLQAGYPINQIRELLLALSHWLVLPSPHVFRRLLDAATRLETALVRTGAVWRHDDRDLSH